MDISCSVTACGKKARKRGWCDMHYRRWRVHGDVMTLRHHSPGDGYLQDGYPGHQRNGVRKFDHIEIVERAIGKPLPAGAVVHHVDEDRTNNTPTNLVVCPDRAYHNLLHARMRAFAACGHYDWRMCRCCKQYDALENMRVYETAHTNAFWHVQCNRDAVKARYRLLRGK